MHDLIQPMLHSGVTLTTGETIPPTTELLITEHCSAEDLDHSVCLKWILFPCAGVPAPMRPVLASRTHLSAHNLHYNDISVSEHAIALLMAAKKHITPFDKHLRQGHWSSPSIDTSHGMLSGSKCLLLGYGAIGKRIAHVLDALGVITTVVKRNVDHDLPHPCVGPKSWLTLLPKTDILICTLPATEETYQMVDQAAFAALPTHAVFINVGRASCVDEQALYQALRSKSIGAAGIDVWWNYPPSFPYDNKNDHPPPCFPSKHPYHELENLVMTPHRGSDYRMETLQHRLRNLIVERINQAAEGIPLPNKVSVKHGY
ncbi:hypothetical protein NT6N_35930 [Oceaniferula spumae]|uniref:D-isomer specific 2-hydroxyacid dehydrogenase NAD-binding domain-containing protein n=1 Tax=Oceaniferula spumae TaxID=2979115 RepID=A0AAT9FRE2_9BACT